MKTNSVRNAILGCSVALALTLVATARAEKGAETLVRLTKAAPASATSINAAPVAHRCASCTDTMVTIVDKGTKGPNHEVRKVARHACAACETKLTTAGVGKARHDVALHTCGTSGTPAPCCASN